MEINLMSWNTELYIYGTRDKNGKIIKPFENAPANEIIQSLNKSSCLKKPVFMRVSAISISLLITN